MTRFQSIDEVFRDSLRQIKEYGSVVSSVADKSSVGSGFGTRNRDFRELVGYSFVLENPRNRLIYSEARRISFGFNVANLIWLLSGRRDVETICFYNRHGKAFSSDGVYYEAAFGDRIFGRFNLWQAARELLAKDKSSRRALIPIFIPTDLTDLPKDTPCAASIQIMIRENKLHFFLHMRSQSAAIVFPYDLFAFTMVHELMSLLLGTALGEFHYFATSFHYYVEEESTVERILSEPRQETVSMTAMTLDGEDELTNIVRAEETIRSSVEARRDLDDAVFMNIPEYWRDLLIVLYLKACADHEMKPLPFESRYLAEEGIFI